MSQRIHLSKIMPRLVLILGSVGVGLIAYFSYQSHNRDYSHATVAVTWPHHLVLFDVNGSPTQIRAERRPLIVHIWASWCAPCIEELPELIEVAKVHPHLDFYLISTDRQSEPLQKYLHSLESTGFKGISNLFIFRDPMKKWMNHLRAQGIPATYLFNSDKSYESSWTGQKKWRVPETLSILNRLK